MKTSAITGHSIWRDRQRADLYKALERRRQAGELRRAAAIRKVQLEDTPVDTYGKDLARKNK